MFVRLTSGRFEAGGLLFGIMLDIPVRRLIDPFLDRFAMVLSRFGVTANQLTWSGFVVGMASGLCIWNGWFAAACSLIAANRLCDGLDGSVARIRGRTDLGGYLDITLDMIFYSAVPFAFALFSDQNALPAAFLIYSFIGTGSSFLAFAIIASKRGRGSDVLKKKSFFYSTGLIEGTETAIYLLTICLIPQYFAVSAWVFGSLCWLTTCIRIATAVGEFKDC